MPYYCTVPRCTSMAGKAKNVSFHQFPRDEELAKLWNKILKRGKPYTKYSKVCSLHFKPEDYTITSVGKNRGQWRTLRKDAIPSQNLPSDIPAPYHRNRSSGMWLPSNAPQGIFDPQTQQQMAQMIYMQTMLGMQAGTTESFTNFCNGSQTPEDLTPQTSTDETTNDSRNYEEPRSSYKCTECSKCFKDPDVFKLHQRVHNKTEHSEKENLNLETQQETLKSNPILANLLKNQGNVNLGVNSSILSIENQIMTAFVANMESYIRNLILAQTAKETNSITQEMDSCTQETDSGTPETDSCTPETDSCTQETDSCKQEMDSCNQEADSCNEETDSCNQDSDSDSRDLESESNNLVIDENPQ